MGVDQISELCYVVKSNDSTLAKNKKNFFRKLSDLFQATPVVVANFSDCGEPQISKALKEKDIHYENLFKFNNSHIFEESEDKSDWDKGVSSFKIFLDYLDSKPPDSQLNVTLARGANKKWLKRLGQKLKD